MRLAVIADVHGNLIALETVLADIARRGSDLIVNLGDCVTSPLWPRETYELRSPRRRLLDAGSRVCPRHWFSVGTAITSTRPTRRAGS